MTNFPKTNNVVVKHNTGVKTLNAINNMSIGAACKEAYMKRVLVEHYEDIDASAIQSEKEYENRQAGGNIASRQILESQLFYKSNDIYRSGKEILFKEIVFELFRKSLNLDEEFVLEHLENLKQVSDSYIDKNGGFKLLETASMESKFPLLKNIQSLCESVAKEVSKKKMKLAPQVSTANQLTFELSEDEKNEFDYEKDKLGMDELAGLVKQKVLTVIQDEKSRQSKEDDLITDIENQLRDDDTVTDPTSAQEAFSKIRIKQNPVEEVTLFSALMHHSYKELLENTATQDSDTNNADDREDRNYKVNVDVDDINGSSDLDHLDHQNRHSNEYDLSGEIGEYQPDKNTSFIDRDEFEIDMDMVLAEALTKYTLIELCHTLQLEKYDAKSVKKLSQKLLQ